MLFGHASCILLLIDNFDSFVHNLARYFERLGQTTLVVRNNALSIQEIEQLQPAAIVISPGPCTPYEAGISLEIVRHFSGSIPILGVCLGHQTIGAAWGGRVIRAPEPMHGRTSWIEHSGQGLFANLPSPLRVCRYHSLVLEADSLPECLEVTARTAEGIIMAVRHRTTAVFGVQFHPEAVLSEGGYALLANFLRSAGLKVAAPLPEITAERPALEIEDADWPTFPFTF